MLWSPMCVSILCMPWFFGELCMQPEGLGEGGVGLKSVGDLDQKNNKRELFRTCHLQRRQREQYIARRSLFRSHLHFTSSKSINPINQPNKSNTSRNFGFHFVHDPSYQGFGYHNCQNVLYFCMIMLKALETPDCIYHTQGFRRRVRDFGVARTCGAVCVHMLIPRATLSSTS